MAEPTNWPGPDYDYLLAPMHQGLKDSAGNESSIALDYGNPKHAPTIHACFDAERARRDDPDSSDTAELVERAKTLRAELAATYPPN